MRVAHYIAVNMLVHSQSTIATAPRTREHTSVNPRAYLVKVRSPRCTLGKSFVRSIDAVKNHTGGMSWFAHPDVLWLPPHNAHEHHTVT